MGNKILDYVEQRLGEKVNFFINIDIREGSYPVELINSSSDKFSICSFIIPNMKDTIAFNGCWLGIPKVSKITFQERGQGKI